MKSGEGQTNIIDCYIKLLRKIIGVCAEDSDNFNEDIINLLNTNSLKAYGFIIDSLYLLEDTQLAKNNFFEFGITGPTRYQNFGEIYLRLYGVLNACYLQQQAIIQVQDNLNILNKDDRKELKLFPLFDLRNTFAAHTVNRGYKENIRSYIVDRFGLLEGNLRAVSSNSKSGHDSKDFKILNEIKSWDELLTRHLKYISEDIVKKTASNPLFQDIKPSFVELFNRINKVNTGGVHYADIWSDDPWEINFVS